MRDVFGGPTNLESEPGTGFLAGDGKGGVAGQDEFFNIDHVNIVSEIGLLSILYYKIFGTELKVFDGLIKLTIFLMVVLGECLVAAWADSTGAGKRSGIFQLLQQFEQFLVRHMDILSEILELSTKILC
jgi:hypothetical protein